MLMDTTVLPRYKDFAEKNRMSWEKRVVRYEYGRGGETLHRGYYCPSLISDIVIGNQKRGNLLKRKTKKPADYIFGFDEKDHLIMVKHYFSCDIWSLEMIYQEESEEIGVTVFSGEDTSFILSRCVYDRDRIMEYDLFYDDGQDMRRDKNHKKRFSEERHEKYSYFPEKLVVDFSDFSSVTNLKKIPHEVFSFGLEGKKLTSYTIEQYEGETRIPSVWDGRIWKVYETRYVK